MPGFDINPVEVGTPPQAPNAMQTIGQLASTVGQLNQNKLFPLQQQILSTQSQTFQQELRAHQVASLGAALAQTTDDSEVAPTIHRYMQAGLIDPDTANNIAGGNVDSLTMPAIHALREQYISAYGNPAELAADRGTTSQITTGPTVQTINTKVAPGGATTVADATGPAASIPLAPSPAEANTKAYDYWDGTQMRTALQGDVASARAEGKLLPGQTTPGGPVAAQPPPGYIVGADASSLQFQKALNQIPEDQALIAQAKNAHDLLNTPGVDTGPGSGAINQWRDLAIRFLGDNADLIPGLDATKLNSANNDELHKDMARLSSALSQESGAPGSDFRLAQSITGNANIDMTNLPNDTVMALNGALLRYRQAGALAFQKSGQPGGDANFTKWLSTNFATKVDPRAFALDMMPAERRQSMIKAMSPTDYKKFMNGVGAATKLNFYQLSDIPGVSQ